MHEPREFRSGFTLIELLVVIAIIAILASLLTPAVRDALERGRQVKCAMNLRSIGTGFELFSNDHDGHYPASSGPTVGPEAWKGPFVGFEIIPRGMPRDFGLWPKRFRGTVSPYLGIESADGGTTVAVLRCPSLPETGLFTATSRDNLGSNGIFDYSMWLALSGALRENLPATAHAYIRTPFEEELPMPLLVEEDPQFYLNNRYIDPGHSNRDRLGSWHDGKIGQYYSVGGAVTRIDNHGQTQYDARTWRARAPSGALVDMGMNDLTFGGWNQL